MNIFKILLFSIFFLLLNFLNYFYFFKKMMLFLIIFFIIIFFANISLCLTIFNDKKYNNVVKNRLIFIIIVFPLFGILFYLVLEAITQKKTNILKKSFVLMNTKNLDWKNTFWPKNNLTFVPNLIMTMSDLLKHAKRTILLQFFSYQEYEFFINNDLSKFLIDIAKTKKIKIFINHNFHIKKAEMKKYKNLDITLNKVPITHNTINSYSTLVIIDGKHAIYGNLSNPSNYNFIIDGEVVGNLQSCFFNWINENKKQNILSSPLMESLDKIKIHFQYFGISTNLNVILLNLIYTAKRSIKIFSNYFVPNISIKTSLLFAIKKNIEVKIITSNSLTNFPYLVNLSLNKLLFKQKNLWWETTRKINDSFIIIDDDIVLLTSNFNGDSFLLNFYPIFWFDFHNKKNYFLEIFNEEIKNCSPIKKDKNGFTIKIKKIFYLIFYPFVL